MKVKNILQHFWT